MIPLLLAVAAGALGLEWLSRQGKTGASAGATYPILTVDPGLDPTHPLGVLPCPTDPLLPAGLRNWQGPVPPAVGAWAVHALHTYPIGTIIEDLVDGQIVAARIEYHTLQGATGKTGCFKGCSMLQPIPASSS